MLETVDVGRQAVGLYESSAGEETVAQLRELSAPLVGARVLHVNATPYGGGVAEILRSEIPLLRDLGLVPRKAKSSQAGAGSWCASGSC